MVEAFNILHNSTKRIYILLHGAWHASWCWHRVIPILKEQGHKVLAPDLSGHGNNTVSFENITLKTYVDEVTKLIKLQDRPVILVGHSMSGIVISQLAENIPEHIEALIYLSGFIPDNNGSLIHEVEKAKIQGIAKGVIVDESNNKITLQLSSKTQKLFFNTCSKEDVHWAMNKLQAQPLRPFVDTVTLSPKRFGNVPKFYIECLKDQAIRIEDQKRMHSKVEAEVFSLNTDHSPFLCAPQLLSTLLINIRAK
ncbi:alpha/beta fold hydrolase [Wolbachia endosymbiont of Folsomia candida]|uniref:alpha/beta fold hydrolase n=1 Tax=Wolbachia endosymbiont of Folsomia candida TaxID=169402 RepID=UPI000A5F2E48|nr:alpha/beta fold hydrolase [Wolbachia endosymbiont of Folsomia candida]APR99079.1 alpha/beta hydrolase [Wolbachia endosymbiont of Folsomia candida]